MVDEIEDIVDIDDIEHIDDIKHLDDIDHNNDEIDAIGCDNVLNRHRGKTGTLHLLQVKY